MDMDAELCCRAQDGSMYEGEWRDDQPWGYGVMTYVNKDEYNGPFVAGLREGEKGTMDSQNIAGLSGVYIGDWLSDEMHGRGTLTWSDGTVYEGTFKDGLMNGIGKMTFADDGGVYEGPFLAGLRHGVGTHTLSDGSCYVGSFLNDVREGNGKYTDAKDGSVYVGDWKDDHRGGQGSITFSNGDVYKGAFHNGLQEGEGELTRADGSWRKGEWARGEMNGQVGIIAYCLLLVDQAGFEPA